MGLRHARQATLQTLKTRTPTRVKCCLNYTAHSTHCHCYSPTTQPQKSTDIQCAHQPLPMSPFVAGLASKGVQALAGGVAGGPAVMPNQPAQPASPTSQPTSQPASQPTSQPANQPASKPTSQPANQPAPPASHLVQKNKPKKRKKQD